VATYLSYGFRGATATGSYVLLIITLEDEKGVPFIAVVLTTFIFLLTTEAVVCEFKILGTH